MKHTIYVKVLQTHELKVEAFTWEKALDKVDNMKDEDILKQLEEPVKEEIEEIY